MNNHRPVIIEQEFNNSKEEVWQAITDVDQMRKWFFENIPDFKAEVGFNTKFNVESGDRNFIHQWEITEVIPGKKIVYDWKYAGYKGDSQVHFEIFGHNDGVTLRVSAIGIENFPQHIPEFTRESCKAGWTYFIKERLKAYLD